MEILNTINGPSDLKKLTSGQEEILCQEIRDMIVETVLKNGGHLASNLGVVELTVALHKSFDSPKDKIIWDVGHQSYAHKILTGRRDNFSTLRKYGGISGFPRRIESEHDAFISGHSSTSVSVACGLAAAKSLKGEDGYSVAVAGDGAMTGGMIWEALNNAGKSRDKIIVVLNDNEMAISENVGALARYLAVIRSREGYFRFKDGLERFLKAIPFLGKHLFGFLSFIKRTLKQALYNSNFFENFGFVYLGPVDGHNISMMCRLFERAKQLDRPCLIHVKTVKGKGYPPAEKDPLKYHGVSPKNPDPSSSKKSYSELFVESLCKAAEADKRICAVTAAMSEGTRLDIFAEMFDGQSRFFDVGIAEQHALTFCAAMATEGLIPVFAVYSTFLQRAYDQIIHDASIEKTHLILAVDRAGIVGEDGETHQGLFDVPLFTTVPNASVYSPVTVSEIQWCLNRALYEDDGLSVIRYPRGAAVDIVSCFDIVDPAEFNYFEGGSDVLIVTYGRVFANVALAAEKLRGLGVNASVLKLTHILPINIDAVRKAIKFKTIVFIEETPINGGIGQQFLSALTELSIIPEIYRIHGIDNPFIPPCSIEEAFKLADLDVDGIVNTVLES